MVVFCDNVSLVLDEVCEEVSDEVFDEILEFELFNSNDSVLLFFVFVFTVSKLSFDDFFL